MIKKIFSVFLVFTAIVLALLLVFSLSINLFFPKQKFINTAANMSRVYLHKALDVEDVSLGAMLDLKIKNLRLSKYSSFSSGNLISVGGMSIKLDLPELVKNKKIVVNAVVDSFSVDLLKKEPVLNQKAVSTAGNKKYIVNTALFSHYSQMPNTYKSIIPWPLTFAGFKLNSGVMHYLYNNTPADLKLSGVLNIFPDRKDNKIDFNDFVLTKGRKNLHVKGCLNNFIEPGNIAFSFSLTGDRSLFQELAGIFYPSFMSDVGIQIGESESVDLTVQGDRNNFRIVSNTKKIK